MYEPSQASPSRPVRWNTALGELSVPSRPLIDHRIARSRVIETTSLSGCSSGLVAGGWVSGCGAVCLSGRVVSIWTRISPADTDARRNSIRLVTMSRYGIRLSSPLSSSSCSIRSSRRLIAARVLERTLWAEYSMLRRRRLVLVVGGRGGGAALRGSAAVGQEVLEPQAERLQIGDDLLHRPGQEQVADHA